MTSKFGGREQIMISEENYNPLIYIKGSVHELGLILGPPRIRIFFILSESAPKIKTKY